MRSERGASLSVAMLLMLVCVALSAAVLAASTASVGRFANQGEMDQRYYAVTSAAHLFSDSLGSDGQVQYVFVQQKTWTQSNPIADGIDNTASSETELVSANTIADGPDSSARGYSFLPSLTWRAIFAADPSPSPTLADLVSAQTILPASCAFVNSKNYTISGNGDLSSKLIPVKADPTLDANWNLTLDFYNGASSNESKYHLCMTLAANVDEQDYTTEEPVEVSGGYNYKVTETRRTIITWSLQRIAPNRGVASA